MPLSPQAAIFGEDIARRFFAEVRQQQIDPVDAVEVIGYLLGRFTGTMIPDDLLEGALTIAMKTARTADQGARLRISTTGLDGL